MRYLARAFTQTAYVAARTGLDSTGKPTYGTPAPVLARVEQSAGVSKRGPQGTTDVTTARLYTPSTVGAQDRVWLPGTPVTALLASLAAPGNAALAATAAAAARLPGPRGCEPNYSLGGVLEYYLTELA